MLGKLNEWHSINTRLIERENMTEKDWDDIDYPCDNCGMDCDGWEAQFCCRLCEYRGGGNCDDCDPMDI